MMGTQPWGERGPAIGGHQPAVAWGTGVGYSVCPTEPNPWCTPAPACPQNPAAPANEPGRARHGGSDGEGRRGIASSPQPRGRGITMPVCILFPGGEEKKQARPGPQPAGSSAGTAGPRVLGAPRVRPIPRPRFPPPDNEAELPQTQTGAGASHHAAVFLSAKPPAFPVFPGIPQVTFYHRCTQEPRCLQDRHGGTADICDLFNQQAFTFKVTSTLTFLRAGEKSFGTKMLFAQTLEKASAMHAECLGTPKNQD